MVSDIAASTRSNEGAAYQAINAVYVHPDSLQSVEIPVEGQIMNDQASQLVTSQSSQLLMTKPSLSANGKLGKGFTDPRVKEWTLFVGQIPHQADEFTLWEVFSAFGEILELNVLRKDGKHRGCAFVAFTTEQMALAAIKTLDGSSFPWDLTQRKLVVRFREKTTNHS